MATTNQTGDVPFVSSVLHPTDFSPASQRAFAHALAIALIREAEFTILHVGPEKQADVAWTKFPPVRETLERWGLLEPGSPRSAVFDRFRVSVNKISVRSRHPVLAIASYMDQRPHDLIVLATAGLDGMAGAFERSQAEAIASWSKTMTLFVPEKAERDLVSFEDGETRLKNILVPFDTTPDCTAAVEFACRVAEIIGDSEVEITLLHAGAESPPSPALREGAGWRFNTEHHQGEPVATILAAAKQREADLIVMATAGRNSVADMLRGSTTEQVLRRAPCAVLAVPGYSVNNQILPPFV